MKIKLITDSGSDLPLNYVTENNIDVAALEVNIKGEFIKDDLGQTLSYRDFYKMLREGELTSTSQVNINTFEEMFEKYVQEGYAILYIGLASVLSGTVNSARAARMNLLEKYPDADITVIDSKSVSLGEGSLVYYACEMLKVGKSKEEVVEWVKTNRTKVNHAITVDDLGFLKRGGRISGTVAAVGTLLNIKPTISLDHEGNVVAGPKVKGSKNALKYLVNEVKAKAIHLEEQTLFICHADAEANAQLLKEMILQENKVKDVMINSIGTVIGTHGGPGTLAVVFLGQER